MMYLTMGSQLEEISIRRVSGLGCSPSVVVDLVTVTRCVHNVQSQPYTILLNDCLLSVCTFVPFSFLHVPCDTVWISVVDRTDSSGRIRPLESMRWDAKMVLINVDFPSPVCPALVRSCRKSSPIPHTNADDIELKASFEQLLLDLLRDRVETNVASGKHCISLWHRHIGGCEVALGRVSSMATRVGRTRNATFEMQQGGKVR